METKLYDYQLHDEICALCMKLSDLSLVNDQLIFRCNGSILDQYDYVYVDFEGRNIYGEDEEGYYVITGVFLWGDCSIEFRVAPLDNLYVGDFACWSDYDEKTLKTVVEHLISML